MKNTTRTPCEHLRQAIVEPGREAYLLPCADPRCPATVAGVRLIVPFLDAERLRVERVFKPIVYGYGGKRVFMWVEER